MRWIKLTLITLPLVFIAASCNNTASPPEIKTNPDTTIPSPQPKISPLQPNPTPAPEAVKPKSSCDPNDSGCVPIASDVDCAGGSGNGPAYVRGPVQVIGSDIYGLDRDGDGIACD